MTELISEVFGRINKAKSRKEKKEILESLKENRILRFVLQGTFDPSIKWLIPKIPKYKSYTDRPADVCEATLHATVPRCSCLVKDHPKSKGVTAEKATILFIQMVELMHKDESDIFAGMVKKKQKCKGLTAKLVLEVFPDLYRKVN